MIRKFLVSIIASLAFFLSYSFTALAQQADTPPAVPEMASPTMNEFDNAVRQYKDMLANDPHWRPPALPDQWPADFTGFRDLACEVIKKKGKWLERFVSTTVIDIDHGFSDTDELTDVIDGISSFSNAVCEAVSYESLAMGLERMLDEVHYQFGLQSNGQPHPLANPYDPYGPDPEQVAELEHKNQTAEQAVVKWRVLADDTFDEFEPLYAKARRRQLGLGAAAVTPSGEKAPLENYKPRNELYYKFKNSKDLDGLFKSIGAYAAEDIINIAARVVDDSGQVYEGGVEKKVKKGQFYKLKLNLPKLADNQPGKLKMTFQNENGVFLSKALLRKYKETLPKEKPSIKERLLQFAKKVPVLKKLFPAPGLPQEHSQEQSRLWPERHEAQFSQTWPSDHSAGNSLTWPRNHNGDFSQSWPRDPGRHETADSLTLPSDHQRDDSRRLPVHSEENSRGLWPTNHQYINSQTWILAHSTAVSRPSSRHNELISSFWPANHIYVISESWPTHSRNLSQNWPAAHRASNSQNWPLGHQINDSDRPYNSSFPGAHLRENSQTWYSNRHDKSLSRTWPADHRYESSSQRWGRDHQPAESLLGGSLQTRPLRPRS